MPADAIFRLGRAYEMTADPRVYLPSQQPALTLAGGRPVHDPDGLFGAA